MRPGNKLACPRRSFRALDLVNKHDLIAVFGITPLLYSPRIRSIVKIPSLVGKIDLQCIWKDLTQKSGLASLPGTKN